MRHYLSIVLAALLMVAAVQAFAVNLTVSGYVQARYSDVFGNVGAATDPITGFNQTSSFYIRRARLNATAIIDPRTTATIEIDAANPSVVTKKAFVSYALPSVTATIGRNNTPFTYENPLSSSLLIPLERSMISGQVPEYATGLFLCPHSNIVPAVLTTFAVLNGNDVATTFGGNSNNKIADANIYYPFSTCGRIGVSAMSNLKANSAYNGYAVYQGKKLTGIAEYTSSKLDKNLAPLKAANHGYYILGAYNVWGPASLYARYDTLNQPNRNLTTAVDDNMKSRETIGIIYCLNPVTKLTAEYEVIHNPAVPTEHGALGVQLQSKF